MENLIPTKVLNATELHFVNFILVLSCYSFLTNPPSSHQASLK